MPLCGTMAFQDYRLFRILGSWQGKGSDRRMRGATSGVLAL